MRVFLVCSMSRLPLPGGRHRHTYKLKKQREDLTYKRIKVFCSSVDLSYDEVLS